jgi:hypothetical protein
MKALVSLFKFVTLIVLGVVNALVGGIVLSRMWAWFVTPTFTHLPALSYTAAVGLLIIVNFMLIPYSPERASEVETAKKHGLMMTAIYKSLSYVFIVYPLALLSAYIWHQFI